MRWSLLLTSLSFAFFKHLSQASHIDRTASYINTTGAPEYVIQKCSITKEEFRMVSYGREASFVC